jgi:hypothetical protein
MSEELKRKLYDYEAEPPEAIWREIAAALDQEINAEFPQKLYTLEETPPAAAWNKIGQQLEKDEQDQYPSRLYNLEVAPRSEVWNKILTFLDKERAPLQIASRGRIILFIRYAVAACVVGLVAFGAFKLMTQKTGSGPVATKTVLTQKDSSTPLNQSSTQQSTLAPSNNLPKENPVLAQTDIKPRRKNLPEPTYMTQVAIASPTATGSKAISDFRAVSLSGDIPGNCSQISDADPYLMFVNPDGYLIRISKKLAETLGCIYTNGNSAEYNRCQEQIKKWRDKIAQSPATSSPDNFMDVLNLIKSVQE